MNISQLCGHQREIRMNESNQIKKYDYNSTVKSTNVHICFDISVFRYGICHLSTGGILVKSLSRLLG